MPWGCTSRWRRFADPDLQDELQRWLYASHLPYACDHCCVPGRPRVCGQPWCITTVGDLRPCILNADEEVIGPDCRAVTWPRCPMLRGDSVYTHGLDTVTAPDYAWMRHEAGSLKDPEASAAEVSFIMSWLRDRELKEKIDEAKRIEQRRLASAGVV